METEFTAFLLHIFPITCAVAAVVGFALGIKSGVVAAIKRNSAKPSDRPKFERVTNDQTKIYEDDELDG